eukprot:6887079-Prorocentrum_lima.AAC.1
MHAARLGEELRPFAATHFTDMMRRSATGRIWTQPYSREVVADTTPRPKKALEKRGPVGS